MSIATSIPMPFISKGWGYELWIDNNEFYCGKQLFIHKGKRLSIHFHKLKRETFFFHEGAATVHTYSDPKIDNLVIQNGWDWFYINATDREIDAEIHYLKPGDNLHIPIGTRHTIKAELNTMIYEFSTQHFDEDSYRILLGDR